MLKLWKVNAKAGDATVKYPFAPFPTNKDMRGKPEHNAELCIACGACGVACPADAIRMDTDLAADTITWSIDYGRCIFCGRCEEACPMEAIKLTEEFELAVMSKDDLTSKSVYTLEHCSRCGKPFAPHKEIDYAKRLLQKAGGMEAEQAARTVGMCQECKRELDALRAASAVKTGNAAGMAANETLASGEPQGPGMEYLGGHGVNPEYIDRELNPDAPEIPAGRRRSRASSWILIRRRSNHGRTHAFARAASVPPDQDRARREHREGQGDPS